MRRVTKQGLSRYINSKMKTGEKVGLLLNEEGHLVTKDTENYFLSSGFTGKTCLQESQVPKMRSKV